MNRDARSDSENIAASNRKSERSTQAWILTRTSAHVLALRRGLKRIWNDELKKKRKKGYIKKVVRRKKGKVNSERKKNNKE